MRWLNKIQSLVAIAIGIIYTLCTFPLATEAKYPGSMVGAALGNIIISYIVVWIIVQIFFKPKDTIPEDKHEISYEGEDYLLKKEEPLKADKNKESVKFWYNRGVDFSHSNDYEKALESYDQALAFDDKDPDIWNNKCYVLIQLKKYDEAIKAARIAVDLSPNDLEIQDTLNEAYKASKNQEKVDECQKR